MNRKNDHNSCCHPFEPCGNSLFSSLSLLLTSVEEEIEPFGNCVDTTQGWTLERLQGLLQ